MIIGFFICLGVLWVKNFIRYGGVCLWYLKFKLRFFLYDYLIEIIIVDGIDDGFGIL